MTILIAKQNESVIKNIHKNVKFVKSTENTSTFNVTVDTFNKIITEVKLAGYNPYALMYW